MARPRKLDELVVSQTLDAATTRFVGLAEIADMLDTSRTQVNRWAEREDFPDPIERLRMGPIWRRSDIERWWKKFKPNGRRKK